MLIICQKQAESQVPKKKKKTKKTKTEDNDSGVEVYFREEEDKEDEEEEEPQSDSVKVSDYCGHSVFFYSHANLHGFGTVISLSRTWEIDYISSLSQQVTHSSAGPSRLQVAAGFSWDVGLSSLKPASAAQEGDSSDGEDQDGSSKVS